MPLATQSQKQDAALLVAKGKLTNAQIAHEVGVSLRSIGAWKLLPHFKELVKQAKDAWRVKARTGGPDDPDRRNLDYKVLRNKLWAAIQARGADPEHQDVPGFNTGLVAVKYKKDTEYGADGERFTVLTPEYENDTASIKALLDIDRQAAEDAGQWKQKKEITVTGPDDGPIQIENVSALTDDELRQLINLARKLNGAEAAAGTRPPHTQPYQQPLSIDGTATPGTVQETP